MIKISKQNNSLIVEGIDNVFYPNNGDNSYPLNSLIVVTDNSDMATFRSVATNDVLFSGLINNITINGEAVTKDNIIAKFDAVSNSTSTGGGGGSVDAYTKTESDAKYATKDELTAVETVANDADTKADAATSRVESVETAMGNKQDILVSGTNIKTINSQSILGEGNIEVSGGTKIYDASEIPENFKNALYQVAYEAYYTGNKTIAIDKSTDVEEFLSNLKIGDYLQLNKTVLIQYYGYIDDYAYKFAIKTGKEIIDYNVYGRLITVQIMDNMFFIKNNASGPVLQKNDFKTINGESLIGEGNLEITIPDATTATSGAMSAADKTKLDSLSNEWTGTQSEYDALTTKEDNKIYYVTE